MVIASIHHANRKENQTLDVFVGTLSKKVRKRIKKHDIKVRDHNGGE